jgi:hypothetical protein
MRWLLRLVAIAAIPCGIAGFYNVYDNSPKLDAAAHRAVCGERGAHCSARMTRQARTPIGRTYSFIADGKPVEVDCRWSLVFVGDFVCVRRGEVGS